MSRFTKKAAPIGIRDLVGVIYGIWEDKYVNNVIKEIMEHVVENHFDLPTLLSDPVPFQKNIVKTPSFECDCGYNEFRSFKDLLICYNCGGYYVRKEVC
jgi:hypothetical protein